MTGAEHAKVPDGVQDLMLWRAAQRVLERHWPVDQPGPRSDRVRACAQCLRAWPCLPYRLACDAEQLAGRRYPALRTTRRGHGGAAW